MATLKAAGGLSRMPVTTMLRKILVGGLGLLFLLSDASRAQPSSQSKKAPAPTLETAQELRAIPGGARVFWQYGSPNELSDNCLPNHVVNIIISLATIHGQGEEVHDVLLAPQDQAGSEPLPAEPLSTTYGSIPGSPLFGNVQWKIRHFRFPIRIPANTRPKPYPVQLRVLLANKPVLEQLIELPVGATDGSLLELRAASGSELLLSANRPKPVNIELTNRYSHYDVQLDGIKLYSEPGDVLPAPLTEKLNYRVLSDGGIVVVRPALRAALPWWALVFSGKHEGMLLAEVDYREVYRGSERVVSGRVLKTRLPLRVTYDPAFTFTMCIAVTLVGTLLGTSARLWSIPTATPRKPRLLKGIGASLIYAGVTFAFLYVTGLKVICGAPPFQLAFENPMGGLICGFAVGLLNPATVNQWLRGAIEPLFKQLGESKS